MKPTHKASAKIETYTDKKTGEEKARFTIVGAGWYDNKNKRFKAKIDSLPVDFDGYIQFFPWEDD